MMINHKVIILVFFTLLPGVNASGTAQAPEVLLYRGDTLMLYDLPLKYLSPELTVQKMFQKEIWCSTACWRGYIATWSIENDSLFLINIRNDCYQGHDYSKAPPDEYGFEYANLKDLFPKKFHNGKVFADWVTSDMLSPQGELLYYVHDGFMSSYEKEVEFVIKEGILIKINSYDNSKSKKPIHDVNADPQPLRDLIHSRIDWKKIPLITEPTRVHIIFTANGDGVIDEARAARGYNHFYDQMAINAILGIGGMGARFKKGEVQRQMYIFPVIFSEENRKKYCCHEPDTPSGF